MLATRFSYFCAFNLVILAVYSLSFFYQLRSEVQRLEELKLLNIRNFTDAIRSEIAVLWEKCFFSTEQRQSFTPYFSGEFVSD